MGSAVEQELLGLLPWAESVPQAIEKAKQERKLILACIRSEFDSRKTIFFEQILLAAVLTDPDILHLVPQRFVPVLVDEAAHLPKAAHQWVPQRTAIRSLAQPAQPQHRLQPSSYG